MKKEYLIMNKVKILIIDKISNLFIEFNNYIYIDRFRSLMKILKVHIHSQVICYFNEEKKNQLNYQDKEYDFIKEFESYVLNYKLIRIK